jgi:hypothetical protein
LIYPDGSRQITPPYFDFQIPSTIHEAPA